MTAKFFDEYEIYRITPTAICYFFNFLIMLNVEACDPKFATK